MTKIIILKNNRNKVILSINLIHFYKLIKFNYKNKKWNNKNLFKKIKKIQKNIKLNKLKKMKKKKKIKIQKIN